MVEKQKFSIHDNGKAKIIYDPEDNTAQNWLLFSPGIALNSELIIKIIFLN
jgi:hypothetical protein